MAALLAVAPPSAAAATTAGCATPADATSLYRSAELAIWSRSVVNSLHGMELTACRKSDGRTALLAHFYPGCDNPGPKDCVGLEPTVSGTYRRGAWRVFYVTDAYDVNYDYGQDQFLAQLDLAHMRVPFPDGQFTSGKPRELAISSTGTLAWIENYAYGFPGTRELLVCDGRCRAAERDADVIARSPGLSHLRFKGNKLLWRAGKRERSRTFA